MSCENCESYDDKGMIAYFRWKKANVGLIGCPQHLKEIMEVLIKDQQDDT